MKETLPILLRVAGAGLLLLATLHVPIARHLKWREEAARLSPVNASVFRVHAFFICCTLVMMGLPCLFDPGVFLENSRAGAWLAWSFSAYWLTRLFFQWFVYPWELWRGKRVETIVHVWFTILWALWAALFALCGLCQSGWLH